MTRTILLEGREIHYDFQRKHVKNMNLRIRSDGTILVSANNKVPEHCIRDFLQKKSYWILRTLNRITLSQSNAARNFQYAEGEAFRLLGKEWLLCPIQGKEYSVTKDGNHLIFTVPDPSNTAMKKRILDAYLEEVCRTTITEICQNVYPQFAARGVPFPVIRFRKMRARWGNCRPVEGILTFNKNLVLYPVSCMEYIVVHEFVHFLQPNHSPRFYEELQHFMPDWKERKLLLENEC